MASLLTQVERNKKVRVGIKRSLDALQIKMDEVLAKQAEMDRRLAKMVNGHVALKQRRRLNDHAI